MNKLKVKEEYDKLTKRGLIDEIKKYINDQLELSRRNCLNDEAYSKAAWPYYQAKELGQQRALTKLLDYLPDIKDD